MTGDEQSCHVNLKVKVLSTIPAIVTLQLQVGYFAVWAQITL